MERTNKEIIENINRLKEEKNAVILAHYYVDGEVQAIAASTVGSMDCTRRKSMG